MEKSYWLPLSTFASALVFCTSCSAGPVGALYGDTNSPSNSTFVLGQPVRITFNLSRALPNQTTSFTAQVVDEYGQQVATLPVSITTNANGVGTYTAAAPSNKLGYFSVLATTPDGVKFSRVGTRPQEFLPYAVVPDPTTRVDYGDASSRFGLQGGFSTAQGSVLPYLGVRYVFAPGWSWYMLEPKNPGQYVAGHPPAPDPASSNLTYGGKPWPLYYIWAINGSSVPSWAVDKATAGTQCTTFSALSATNQNNLKNFAAKIAADVSSRFPGQTKHYYQMTWEPQSPWCFGGTSAQLAQYYSSTYAAIKAADPKAMVTGPTLFSDGKNANGSVDQMAELWSAGLAKNLDAVSMHPYENPSFPPENTGFVAAIRRQMSMASAAKGASVPFIGTEHGFNSGSVTPLQQAQANVRQNIILLGEGFKFDLMFYIHDFWDKTYTEANNLYGLYYNLNSTMPYGSNKIAPKVAAPAYSAMTYFLDGSTSNGSVTSGLSGTQLGYKFTRGSTTITALWDYRANSSSATVPIAAGTYKLCNWMGNCSTATSTGSVAITLSGSPIYIIR